MTTLRISAAPLRAIAPALARVFRRAPSPREEAGAPPVPPAVTSALTRHGDEARPSRCPFHRVLSLRAAPAKAALSADERAQVAARKATCPFMGAAVATGALPVRGEAAQPLASIDDVVALGNSGGGDLGQVLAVFARGNHAKMPGIAGAHAEAVPFGMLSLDFPGSQGAHAGHSGILMGDPTQVDSGRFSEADYARLVARARDGVVPRSAFGAFIAENVARDPFAKVLDAGALAALARDAVDVAATTGPALLEHVERALGTAGEEDERRFFVALTKLLGEDNLVGSAGEFGLLFAFLEHSPKTRVVDGEPAIAIDDLNAMFRDKRLPDGWDAWKKTKSAWVRNTAALALSASRALRGHAA